MSSATEGSDARKGGPQDEEAELPSILAGDAAEGGFCFGMFGRRHRTNGADLNPIIYFGKKFK